MKDNKNLLMIVGAALFLSIILLLIMLFGGNKKDDSELVTEGDPVVLSVPKENITAFSLGEKTFRYTDSGWIYEGDETLPVAPDFIEDTVTRLSVISASGMVAEDVKDLSPYGLDGDTVSLSVTADKEYRLIFGQSHFAGGYYMRLDGDKGVFVGGDELYSLCFTDEEDFAALGSLPDNFGGGNIKRVNINGADYNDEALLREIKMLSLDDYAGFDKEGITDGKKVIIYYSAATEDYYGTASYSIEFTVKGEGEYILFTYGDDGIFYQIKKSSYPELSGIIG